MHSLFRVSEGEHGLSVRYLEDESLHSAIRAGGVKVEHIAETWDYGWRGTETIGVRLLTASTKKLTRFLKKIGDQKDLFEDETSYGWMGPLIEKS